MPRFRIRRRGQHPQRPRPRPSGADARKVLDMLRQPFKPTFPTENLRRAAGAPENVPGLVPEVWDELGDIPRVTDWWVYHKVVYRLYADHYFEITAGIADILNKAITLAVEDGVGSRRVTSSANLIDQLGVTRARILRAALEDGTILHQLLEENLNEADRDTVIVMLQTLIGDVADGDVDDDDALTELINRLEAVKPLLPASVQPTIDIAVTVIESIDDWYGDFTSGAQLPDLEELILQGAEYIQQDLDAEGDKYHHLRFYIRGNYTMRIPSDFFAAEFSGSSVYVRLRLEDFEPDDDAEVKVQYWYKIISTRRHIGTGWLTLNNVLNFSFDSLTLTYRLYDRIADASSQPVFAGEHTFDKFFVTSYGSTQGSTLVMNVTGLDADFTALFYISEFILVAALAALIIPGGGLAVATVITIIVGILDTMIEDSLEEYLEGQSDELVEKFDALFVQLFKRLDVPDTVVHGVPFREEGEYSVPYSLVSDTEEHAFKIYTRERDFGFGDDDDDGGGPGTDGIEEPEDPTDDGPLDELDPLPVSGDGAGDLAPFPELEGAYAYPTQLMNRKGMIALKRVLDSAEGPSADRDRLIVSLLLDGYSPRALVALSIEEARGWLHDPRAMRVTPRTKEALHAYSGLEGGRGTVFSDPSGRLKLDERAIRVIGGSYFAQARRLAREVYEPEEVAEIYEGAWDAPPAAAGDSGPSPFHVPNCRDSESTLARDYGSLFDPTWLGLSVNCYLANRLYQYLRSRGYFDVTLSIANPDTPETTLDCTIERPGLMPRVDFSGNDGDKPQLKGNQTSITVTWGTDPAEAYTYQVLWKVELRPTFIDETCLSKLGSQCLLAFAKVIDCLREEGIGISDEKYLASLFQHFIFLELLIDTLEIEIESTDIDDIFEETARESMLTSALKEAYAGVLPIPILFDAFYNYTGGDIQEYDVADGWINMYKDYELGGLNFDFF